MLELYPDPPVFNIGRRVKPIARVSPGDPVRFHTTDAGYREALERGLDSDPQLLHRLNALTGPVFVDGAMPGDTLIVHVDSIEVGDQAYTVHVDRWGRQTYGMTGSWIEAFPIKDGLIWLDSSSSIQIWPMIGCAGIAPAASGLSSLSPTSPEGGNLDIRALVSSTRLLLPVAVEGGLFALGDLHAAMGTGEPAGAGFECAGIVGVRFSIRRGLNIFEPRLETDHSVTFIGSDPDELYAAKQRTIAAAWHYLREECGIEERRAFALVSGLLHLEFGGPAGANVLATFTYQDLRLAGVNDLPA